MYQLQKTTSRAASEILQIVPWASEMIGMDDRLTALAFDRAVLYLGATIESKLLEYDDFTKRPKYTLEQLLREESDQSSPWWEEPLPTQGLKTLLRRYGSEW